MPLDLQSQALLDQGRAAGGPPLYEMPLEHARAALKGMAHALGPRPPEGVRTEDHVISQGHVPLRVYTPPGAARGARPLAVLIHGGGFFLGDIDIHDGLARTLAIASGAVIVSVGYRLAPENRFPAALDDCMAAVRWAAAVAPALGADAARVSVMGDSAGGNLAAVVCQQAKAEGRPALARQVLLYPCVDLDPAASYPSRQLYGGGDYFLGRGDLDYIARIYPAAPHQLADPRLSPIKAVDLKGLPPALIITAGFDPLRDEGRAYADRLAATGVPVTYKCFDTTIHGFASFAGAIPAGAEALDLAARFIAEA